MYWGRRGPLSLFTRDVMRAALKRPNTDVTVSISRQNESFDNYSDFGARLFPVDTFSSNAGVALAAWRIALIRAKMAALLKKREIGVVIDLMPHVWTPFVIPAIKAGGARYVPVLHDADMHPGDYRSRLASALLNRALRQADVILTLSAAVAGRLEAAGRAPSTKVFTLFHPDLDYQVRKAATPPEPGEPMRLLFLGRIMPYKGLSLFVDAVEQLRRRALPIEVGVFGEGDLGANAERLKRLGAEVENRWLQEREIGPIHERFHAVVLSHVEASQSGIAAAAFGAGRPVIATPVGGLIEQVRDGYTGILAARADVDGLADAIQRLYRNPGIYQSICLNLVATSDERSMRWFVDDCITHALYAREAPEDAHLVI